jgi:hypothetical protein
VRGATAARLLLLLLLVDAPACECRREDEGALQGYIACGLRW